MASKTYDDLSKDELVRLRQARDRRDATRFGLVWEANEIERDRALNQDFVALDRDLSCPPTADGWKNLIIEGDNFDALRYLRMTFAGRVKCIYIDPPYNTRPAFSLRGGAVPPADRASARPRHDRGEC